MKIMNIKGTKGLRNSVTFGDKRRLKKLITPPWPDGGGITTVGTTSSAFFEISTCSDQV